MRAAAPRDRAAVVQTIRTTGDGVQLGDVITVGGIPHIVIDVRDVAANRRRIQFADGNAYVVGRAILIEVTRALVPRQSLSGTASRVSRRRLPRSA